MKFNPKINNYSVLPIRALNEVDDGMISGTNY